MRCANSKYMNEIETRGFGKIILNKDTPQPSTRYEHFFIPHYQLGYRWEETHVQALLKDIYSFMASNESNYYLQPIVVMPAVDPNGHTHWEVIDGQQRQIWPEE